MVKLKMKTGEYYSSDYTKYPLNSLKPFILLFFFFLAVFLFFLLDFFLMLNVYVKVGFNAFFGSVIAYWVYLIFKYPPQKVNSLGMILAKTRFEKKTAKDKFKDKNKTTNNFTTKV